MLSVGFAGQWEFVEKYDDATNKDRSYVRLDSESDPDTSVIVIRCNGADQFAAYITTAELFIHKTGTDDGGSSPLYTQVEWKFDSQDATTDLLTVAVSREAVFFSTDEQLGSFFGGLNAGGNFLNVDFSKLINYGVETNLPNIDNKFSPNFGAGVYYYTERFYAGLSIPDFLQTKHFDDSGETASFVAKDRMNLYLTSGYVFDLNANVKFRPAVMVKVVNGAPIQADVSASFMFSEKFVLGAAYRWNAAVSALASFQVMENFMIGLAYDMDTTSLGNTTFNDGSFEVFIRYDFLNRYNRRAFNNRFF